ncbi:hypothetical protein IAQ67_28395 (plasmid) [Paenibacillus peoriae]|uniref:Thymidine kinase n=2 Tax=Paenibacillus peoriae TaxID=59893 RepID=A0A7H0YH81_9BACL|nr:hypothetical protein IAQ67_28395 [Paenibacillus peoriae]
MGAGKTKALVLIHDQLVSEGKEVVVFKHVNDIQRGGQVDKVTARDGSTVSGVVPLSTLSEILFFNTDQFHTVLIDEIQFFDDADTIPMLNALTISGIDVHVFGLDVTSDNTTFGVMGNVLAQSDRIEKLKPKCYRCEGDARISSFVGGEKDGDVHVGDLDEYKPICRRCYFEDMKLKKAPQQQVKAADKEHTFKFNCAGFSITFSVTDSQLAAAGYTIDEVNDINTEEGMTNLLEDLGLEIFI